MVLEDDVLVLDCDVVDPVDVETNDDSVPEEAGADEAVDFAEAEEALLVEAVALAVTALLDAVEPVPVRLNCTL